MQSQCQIMSSNQRQVTRLDRTTPLCQRLFSAAQYHGMVCGEMDGMVQVVSGRCLTTEASAAAGHREVAGALMSAQATAMVRLECETQC